MNLDWIGTITGQGFMMRKWEGSMALDPLVEDRTMLNPYNYTQNNPLNRIELNGALDTKYEDEEGNLLLNTLDNSNAVVTVTDEKRKAFDASVKGTKNTNDVVWNNTTKRSLGSENIKNSLLHMFRKIRKTNPGILHPKQIRASVIVYRLKHFNLRQIQYFAGHKYVSSTEHYQMNKLEGLKKSLEEFHPLK